MSGANADMSPTLKRTIRMMALIEAIILGAGIAAYLATDNIYIIVATVVVAGLYVATTLLRAMARERAGLNAPKSGSIVE